MDEEKFWDIIEQTIVTSDRNMSSYLAELAFQLEQLTIEEVIQWDAYFMTYKELAFKEKLWAGAFILNKGDCDEDGFDSFRSWLISMGKKYYFRILKEVDELGNLQVFNEEQFKSSFEDVSYVAQEVFVDKMKRLNHVTDNTGEELYFKYMAIYELSIDEKNSLADHIVYDEEIDLPWSDSNLRPLKIKLPQLSKRFLGFMEKNATRWDPDDSLFDK